MDNSNRCVFINNSFVEETAATLHISDLALVRGYGIFDYFKIIHNKPLFLNDHLNRFYASAAAMHLTAPLDSSALHTVIMELIQKNNLPHSGMRLTLTGGYTANGYTISNPNLIIHQQPLTLPTEKQFEQGLKLMTYNHQRQLPQVKTIDYLMAIWLQPRIKAQGANDVLYHNNGAVTECPRANFFMVTPKGVVLTPEHNILNGITRKRLLQDGSFPIETRQITLDEVYNAKEAFISSTTKQILPVLQIDGYKIGDGKPGPVTRAFYDRVVSWSC